MGHSLRLHHHEVGSPGGNAYHRRERAKWPSKETFEQLLEEHGTLANLAEALGRTHDSVRKICDRLGVDYLPHGRAMGDCTVALGWTGEEHAAKLLGAELTRGDAVHAPFDLVWNGLRVEVKTARPSLGGPKPQNVGWSFCIATSRGKNDGYFLIGCDESGEPSVYFLVPASVSLPSMIRIPVSLRSKWAPFLWSPMTDPRAPVNFSRSPELRR